jgi:hypothetical protein
MLFMAALTLGLAKVDLQLGLLRRRLNLRRLLDAIYMSGALAAAALSVLIVSALRGTPATFSCTLWAITLLTGTATALAMVRVRRNWLSLEQTARIADQEARLEDRLSTLINHRPASEKPSRMTAVLLSQVLSVAQRWEPRTLVPVRVPRSIYVCLAAFALLAATALLEQHQPDKPTNLAPQPTPASNVEKPSGSAASPLLHPESNQDAEGKRARGPSKNSEDASGVLASLEANSPVADEVGKQKAPTGNAAGGTSHSESASSKIQTLIRQALGGEPLAPPDRTSINSDQTAQTAGDATAPHDSTRSPAGQTSGGNRAGQGQSESNGDADQPLARHRDAHGPDDGGVGNEHSNQQGSGSGAAEAAGGAPFGPPGTTKSADNAGATHSTFTIRLTETSRVVYTTLEHQPGKTGQQIPVATTDAVLPREQPLNPQSSEQRGLHRTTIPTEHEVTVRRIFSRQADGG